MRTCFLSIEYIIRAVKIEEQKESDSTADTDEKKEVSFTIDIEFFRKHWWAFALLATFLVALYIRMQALQNMHYLFDIDLYYFARMTEYAAEHGLQLPIVDTLRYYPTGYNPFNEYFVGFLFPASIFMIVKNFGVAFIDFVRIFPMVLGSLFIVPIFLIGRELKDNKTGLLAAFLFATSASMMYRTVIFEKEVMSGFFLLFAVYFFIRAVKKDSWISGIAAGLSTAMVSMMWGGVVQIFFGLFMLAALLLFINKFPKGLFKAYLPTVIIGMLLPSLFLLPLGHGKHPGVILNMLILGIFSLRLVIEKYKWVSKENMPFVVPGLCLLGGVGSYIGAAFLPPLANMIRMVQNHLFYTTSTFMSTVAENKPLSWHIFNNEFSTFLAGGMNPIFAHPIFYIASIWVLAAVGISIAIFKLPERKWDTWLSILLVLITFASYVNYLQTFNTNAQMVFMGAFFLLIFLISRRDWLITLMLVMILIPMLGSLTRTRIVFILGPYFMLFAAYAISKFIDFIRSNGFLQSKLKTREQKNVLYGLVAFLIGIMLITNFMTGYLTATYIGPGYNDNWDEAMTFMRERTPEESVILSWWDYGYWFQTMSKRPSNLDGGNQYAVRNIPTGQYFTGMMNESQQKFYLQKMGTDYILVDASMIGKTAAMSKIANYDQQIDVYNLLPQGEVYQKGNRTIITYEGGGAIVWAPIWPENGTLAGDIMMTVPQGEGYIKYMCTAQGHVDMNPSDDKPAFEWSIIIGQGFVYLVSPEICNSPNTKLLLFNGESVDYATQVFNNGEIKIYEVDHSIIPREATEELKAWWNRLPDSQMYRELLVWEPGD